MRKGKVKSTYLFTYNVKFLLILCQNLLTNFISVLYNCLLIIKGKTIRTGEQKWVEVEEARKLGISVAAFLKLLIKQYFNGIKFERERKEKVCRILVK